jgi:serine/threonine protein kinase
MSDETVLGTLLSAWQLHRDQGCELPATALCADRPDLAEELQRRIDAVRRLDQLARYAHASATLPAYDPEAGSRTQKAVAPRPAPLSTCSAVPGYEFLCELGRGGMGVVYKARHIGLNRVVALKMILAGGHAGPDELARFRGEAEAVARLKHPNVVPVYDVGESGGLPYFSLEYVEGGSLDKKLAGTPLPPKEAAALVEALARAVAAAHEKGIVHRDLKPANVLLAEDGTPKITDFGLAKKLDAPGQTATGAVLGTPSYMAPEQASGKSSAIGPRCDLYALGAILYECLTGRPPFKAASVMETLRQVMSDEPAPPRQLQSRTPRDLETICLKCLHKEPHKRYPSAQELAEDLRRFRAGEPIRARPLGRVERGWRWCRRNPAVTALLAALLVVLVGSTGVGWALAIRAEAAAAETRAALKEKDEAGQRERMVTTRLIRFMKKNPEYVKLPSNELMARFLEANDDVSIADFDVAQARGTEAASTAAQTLLGD